MGSSAWLRIELSSTGVSLPQTKLGVYEIAEDVFSMSLFLLRAFSQLVMILMLDGLLEVAQAMPDYLGEQGSEDTV
jgi:hypothetical protein